MPADVEDNVLDGLLDDRALALWKRRVLDGSPVRVEYSLTPKGEALEPALRALKQWARENLPDR